MEARFGPAGNSDSFYAEGLKDSAQMPAWLQGRGLNAYEYQCSRGVHVGEATARKIGQQAALAGVSLSIHAPYYINMATEDAQIRQNSKRHLVKSLQVARWMGARRVVFHPGGTKPGREIALNNALRFLTEVLAETEEYGDIQLAPETMGKRNQLGSDLDEVIGLCKLSSRVVPAVDFGHYHAVTGGSLLTKDSFLAVLEHIGHTLGPEVLHRLHIHFSPIEFTKAGEKRHGTFADKDLGPSFTPLAEAMAALGMAPTVICESAGSQAEDALLMKQIFEKTIRRQAEKGS